MMSYNNYLMRAALCTAIAMGCLCSCTGEGESEVSALKYITVAPSIVKGITRTYSDSTGTHFSVGDGVTVYAWTGANNYVVQPCVVDGVVNTLGEDGTWSAASPMTWGDMVSPHYFLGIYPPRTVTDFYADPFSLTPGDENASDLLVGTNTTGLLPTDEPVGIVFDHLMAMLQVNLLFRNQWPTVPDDVSVGCTALTEGTIYYMRKYVAATGDSSAVTLHPTVTADGYALSHRAIMIPQRGLTSVTVTVEGREFTYTHPRDIPLESGRITTVNLILGRQTIELGSIVIDDWEEGRTITGTGLQVQ